MDYSKYDASVLYSPGIRGIDMSQLELVNCSAADLSDSINIDISTLYDKPFWFKCNGEYYYFKELTSALKVLNELLGEYFSTYMDLPTVNYDIALSNDSISGVLSKNFREKGKKYVDANNLPLRYYAYLDYLLRFSSDSNNELKRKLDSMIAKDVFTCMCDREINTLCTLDGGFDIAPLYDYELSMSIGANGFPRPYNGYSNPLFVLFPYFDRFKRKIDDEYLTELIQRDSQMRRECEKMYAVDMRDALNCVANKHGIFVPDEIASYYVSFYDDRKKVFMKTLR